MKKQDLKIIADKLIKKHPPKDFKVKIGEIDYHWEYWQIQLLPIPESVKAHLFAHYLTKLTELIYEEGYQNVSFTPMIIWE